MASQTCSLFVMGQPILDILVNHNDGEKLLAKYDLKANDIIYASEKHELMCDEIKENYNPTFIAGGSAQNSAKAAAYILPPNSVVFTGCVGSDEFANQLRKENEVAGLSEVYHIIPGEQTATCIVVITGSNRSGVLNTRAANKFNLSYLTDMTGFVHSAKFFYAEGFILEHAVDAMLKLSEKASRTSKVFALNFSAPVIVERYFTELQSVLLHCDIIFGNESEAKAYASVADLPNKTDLAAIAKHVAISPKSNTRPRIVIFTNAADPTIMVTSTDPDSPKSIGVTPISKDMIVDTTGAGDAFVGGFLGAFIGGEDFDSCVEKGHRLAAMCIQRLGAGLPYPKLDIL